MRYTHHIHKDLLMYANNIIKVRDEKGLKSHIGKVKSHTGVTYTDVADKARDRISVISIKPIFRSF